MDNNRTTQSRLPQTTANGLSLHGSGAMDGLNPPRSNGTVASDGDRTDAVPAAYAGGREAGTRDLLELLSQLVLIIRAKWWWGIIAALGVGGLVGWALLHRSVEYE